MGIYCQNCDTLHKRESIPRKCPKCGNTDITKFIRADECDFDLKATLQAERDRIYLMNRRV
jgi:Zn finger protein HypA/HybF involved in hydrogenase expression